MEINKGPLGFWKRLEQGNWEIELMRFSAEIIKPGDTILDVGAWIEPLTFLFSHLVGRNGSVHAFDPMLESFSLIEHYTNTNNKINVKLNNIAISNTTNDLILHFPSSLSTMTTALKPNSCINPKIEDIKNKFQLKTKCTTLDKYCLIHNIYPDGIKIDVEGMEGYVLEGAMKTIKKHHPWCILEFHGHILSKSERQQAWSFITDRTRKIRYINDDEKNLTYNMQVPYNFKPTKRANYCIYF